METVIILGFGAATSGALYLIGKTVLGLRPADLRRALALLLEIFGVSIVLMAVNISLVFFALLAIRLATPLSVSLYLAGAPGWMLLSLIQGFLFQCWRGRLGPGRSHCRKS